jgi:hypothetical protein
MRLLLSLALASLSLTPAATAATKAALSSWGKLHVSFEQYRQDAVDCTREGVELDVSGTEAAKTFKRASAQLEANETNLYSKDYRWQMLTVARSASIVEGTQPKKRLAEVRALQEQTVAACLTRRGYKQFNLTQDQQNYLASLKKGSEARHRYLYSLAVDPTVLSQQAS